MNGKRWKCDVAVVGGGVAGMAAAIRTRFMREQEQLPLSVALFESAELGGLLRTGERRIIAGPSSTIAAGELLHELTQDMERYEIPVIRQRVHRIGQLRNDRFTLHCGDGSVAEATAVILATGVRPMSNELDYYGDGVTVTYRGLSYLRRLVQRAADYAEGRPLAVVTNRNVRALQPFFWRHPADYLFLVPPGHEEELQGLPGAVVATTDWRIASRDREAFTLSVETPEDGPLEFWARAILVDYSSFQAGPLLPELDFQLEHSHLGLPRVDSFLQSSMPGLYLAGDVTGRYATVSAALADGISAGIGACGHVYRVQYGETPPPLCRSAERFPEGFLENELPVLSQGSRMKWVRHPPAGHPLAGLHGHSLAQVAEATLLPPDKVYALVYQALRDQYITVE